MLSHRKRITVHLFSWQPTVVLTPERVRWFWSEVFESPEAALAEGENRRGCFAPSDACPCGQTQNLPAGAGLVLPQQADGRPFPGLCPRADAAGNPLPAVALSVPDPVAGDAAEKNF
ncbi:hypothetical protein R0K18_14905 [Pantoea sp. SIMBA_133]